MGEDGIRPVIAGADGDSAGLVRAVSNLILGALGKVKKLLRTCAEMPALLSEGDFFAAAHKKRFAQFPFEVFKLPRKSGLGEMKLFGCMRDRFLPRDCKEIFEYT